MRERLIPIVHVVPKDPDSQASARSSPTVISLEDHLTSK
jgi:hypothetical protein